LPTYKEKDIYIEQKLEDKSYFAIREITEGIAVDKLKDVDAILPSQENIGTMKAVENL
jgi:hypothetical protein